MLDVFYLKGRELTEEEEDALTLPFEDFDEQGQYVPIEAEEVIAGYKQIFENAAAMINGIWNKKFDEGESPKPCYKTADGKYIPCWIKLLRCRKQKGQWRNIGSNGELTFDNFIGNGFVELQKGNNPPAVLRLDLSRESIIPKEVAKVPTIGNMAPQGSIIAPMVADMGAINNEAYNEAVKDMPF